MCEGTTLRYDFDLIVLDTYTARILDHDRHTYINKVSIFRRVWPDVCSDARDPGYFKVTILSEMILYSCVSPVFENEI